MYSMKTKYFFLAACFILAITGCKKNGVSFTISNQVNFRVENTSPLNLPFEIATPDVTTNSSQEFQNNHTSSNLVKEVKLEELKLTITSPAGKTFSFLKTIKFFISTNGSDEIELATLDNISSTSQTILLNTTQQNLEHYIKASSYKLRTQLVIKETVTQAIDVRTDLKFRITASLL
jgi:hypothetical protein